VKRVVEMTLRQKPAQASHWSTRTMAQTAGISEASVVQMSTVHLPRSSRPLWGGACPRGHRARH
jgi:hypothetical protein